MSTVCIEQGAVRGAEHDGVHSFLNASSAVPLWSGQWLVKRAVLVVSIKYRLGAFGFLTRPELGANFGVLNWVSALTWVHTNIAAFGGNPDNITVPARVTSKPSTTSPHWPAGGATTGTSRRTRIPTPLPRPCFRSCTA